MATCPMCAEDVAATSTVCPHCGNLLRPAVGVPSNVPSRPAAAAPARGVGQWIIPGVLTVAVVLVLVAKFAWWDRRWQGSTDACEAVTALTGLHLGSEELDQTVNMYFANSREIHSAFVLGLSGEVSRLEAAGTLRTQGIPVAAIERLYATTMQRAGVSEEQARVTLREHLSEILSTARGEVGGYLTPQERAGLRAATAACRGSTSSATTAAEMRPSDAGSPPEAAPSALPPAPQAAPPAPAVGRVAALGAPVAAPPAPVGDAATESPTPANTGRTPPPCVAGCIRTHRAAYVRCADDCVRLGNRGSECNGECGGDYERCLNDECHFTGDDTPWFRPDVSVPAEGADAGTCTYATRDAFHLRARPTTRRAGAAEITSNPVVELLRAERLRRGSERMFRVRLPDGREGWMFVPEAEVPPGCQW